MSRSSGTVTRHYLCLTSNDGENAPVADDEDCEDPGIEEHKVADPMDYFDDTISPDDVAMAHAVNHGAGLESNGHVENNGADPRKCHQTARRPLVPVSYTHLTLPTILRV